MIESNIRKIIYVIPYIRRTMQNFYTPPELFNGAAVTLAGDEYRHAARSCRVRVGELIGVTDGAGRRVEARVETIGTSSLSAAVVGDLSGKGEPAREITLALALIKPARFETAVEKCTELGVRRIVPLAAARCERGGARPNYLRLRRIALEAAKQAGRSWIPEIASVADIESVCRGGGALIAAAKGADLRVREALARFPGAERVTLLVGPEGDFTSEETTLMIEMGAVLAGLGGLTLRAETAAVAAVALVVSAVSY